MENTTEKNNINNNIIYKINKRIFSGKVCKSFPKTN